MLDPEVTDASCLYLSVLDGILNRFPGLQPHSLSSVRAVQEEQINISQSALFHGLFDGLASRIVRGIRCQL